MIQIKKTLFLFLFLFITIKTNSQNTVLKENSIWFNLSNQFKVSDKFYFANVVEVRTIDFLKHINAFYFKPSINYNLNKKVTFTMGYTFYSAQIHGVNHPIIARNENRLWQSVVLKGNAGKVNFNNRFVFEERFKGKIIVDGDPPYISGTTYAQRYRYRINVTFNLVTFKNEKPLLMKISEEVRVRFNDGLSNASFDQNNFYVYLGYPLVNNSKIWVGYGRDYYKITSDTFVANDILRITYSYNFDFTKKNKNKKEP